MPRVLGGPVEMQRVLGCIGIIGLCSVKPSQTFILVVPFHLLSTLHMPLL